MNHYRRRRVSKTYSPNADAATGSALLNPSELFRDGLRHHQAARFAEAEACYRQVLRTQPDNADALHLLGVIAHQAGRHDAAVELIREAIGHNGKNSAYFSSLAAALYVQGKLDEAIVACRQVTAIKPNLAEAHSNLGVALYDQGKLDEAIAAYQRAIRLKPDFAEAHCNVGVALYAQKKLEQAVAAYRSAVRIKPNFAEAYFNLGNALEGQGKLDEAVAAYRQAISIRPDHAGAYSNLGNALEGQGKLDEAIAAFRQAVGIKPDFAEAHSNLGAALRKRGELDDAAAACRRAISFKSGLVEAYCNLGATLFDQGKLDEGVAAYRQAITREPNFPEVHHRLGLALLQFGRLPEARAALESAIRLDPRNAKYRRALGEIAPFAAGDPHLEAMEQLARDRASLPVENRIELHFALAKAYEDLGRHADAFRQWVDGNALKRQQIAYNEATTLAVLDYARAAFTCGTIRTWQNVGNPSSVPVFIIGMMRSGSTLVEQILASHPQVFGGGELIHFRRAAEETRTTLGTPATFPELVSAMIADDYRDLGTRYLSEIERLAPDATHITDKTLENFIVAGLIHIALPNASIIHTVRDPIDTCLSCFSKLFGDEQNHTYDLAELGRYYRHYQALMAHWHRVLPPGRILDVRYEDVVADLEGQARRIIAYCGLDWDPRCVAFDQTERPVRTYSAIQVRRPIYDSAVGRWQVYAEFLDPLFAELGVSSTSNLNRAAPKE